MAAGEFGGVTAMKILTGVGAHLSAAHYSRDGKLHGHTWEIVAWWSDAPCAISKQIELNDLLSKYDHEILPNNLAWGEDMAAWILGELDCRAVDISRSLERIFVRVEKE